MDARSFRPMLGAALVLFLLTLDNAASAQFGRRQQFTAHSQNFIVFASTPQWAAQVAEMAELNRRDLAIHWLGSELPPWSERVPIHVQAGADLGAGGETRFSLIGGNRIGNWMMSVSGTQERILDSVLPHEITHTIFATHFAPLGKYAPRWADEGACTTVEHISEKQKHQKFLHQFLATGRGLAFNTMFNLKEYPTDIMPLYAQGHSAVQFLIDQGGPQKFVKFLEAGMRSEAWGPTLEQFYAYESIGSFQTLWNQWLADGSPQNLIAYAPGLQREAGTDAGSSASVVLASNAVPVDVSPSNANPRSPAAAVLGDRSEMQLAAEPLALDAQPANSVSLASHAAATSSPLGNENWYKRRLREVTGEEPPLSQAARATEQPRPISMQQLGRTQPSGNPRVGIPHQSVSHAPQRQSQGIQVLDWGDSEPVPGIAPNLRYAAPPPGMVPLYR
ncbi:MAG: hypothetical protein R3C56_09995 [Pirellulaceae bacterium]